VGIGVCEIASHHHKYFISLIHIQLLINPSSKQIDFIVSVEVLIASISNSGLITAEAIVKPEDERYKTISKG
jgi:hypothetical protein